MRLLYVSKTKGPHDDRFIEAWESEGFLVEAIECPPALGRHELASRITAFAPDIIQAGPLLEPVLEIGQVWAGPLIATSWGFDLLLDCNTRHEELTMSNFLARADLVFVDNEAVRDRAIALGAVEDAIALFPWGLAREWFEPRSGLEPERPFAFLTTRSHEPIYRVADVLQAFLQVADSHPNTELWVVGSGSTTSELEHVARLSAHRERVKFLGKLGPRELRSLYRSADLYISTSIVDGSSVSLLEAMASRLPALVSDIPGNHQWVSGATGFMFPVADVAALASRMAEIADLQASDPGALNATAEAAFRKVSREAVWEETVNAFPSHARRAISRNRVRTAREVL